jgi:hypothetical protein
MKMTGVGLDVTAGRLAELRSLPQVPTGRKEDAKLEFQALVLTSMVEEMLPKDAENVYGSGVAGSVWRSMLAEKIAHAMAQRDVLGLAPTLERHIETLTMAGKSPAGTEGA